MLMPMVFAGSAGSLLVLTGSPVNIIVSEAAAEAGGRAFGYFEFAWVGVPLLVGTMVLAIALAPRMLPDRTPAKTLTDLSRHAEVLAKYYALADGFYRLRVRTRSPLVGTDPDSLDLSDYPGTSLLGLQAGPSGPRPARDPIEVDDVLVVSGPSEQISRLAIERVLAVAMTPLREDRPEDLVNRQVGVAEVVVPPRSPLVGETVFPGMAREHDLVVLAVGHRGRDVQGQVTLGVGDTLLVYGSWTAMDTLVDDRDVVVVDSPELIRRQVSLGPKAVEAGAVLAAMVTLLALGLVPPAVAGLLAAGAMVLTGVLSSQRAYRSVSWETVVLVGGLIPLSTAIGKSGAGQDIADVVLDVVGTDRPRLLMAAVFVLTAVLGLVLSNAATVLIALPIALATAADAGVAVQPMLMNLAVASSAALLTPVQTPGNMMVMAPGGYRFGDYWKLGLPITGFWLVVALVVIPVAWPL
jgi:di/tricarboxylate transporter